MYKFLLISVLFTLFPFNHIRGQIYVYHTSDTECKYPYEYILFAGDRILGIVRNFNETDANILGYYRDIYDSSNPMYSCYASSRNTWSFYSKDYSTNNETVFVSKSNGKSYFDSFTKNMQTHYNWNTSRTQKRKYTLIRTIHCDVADITKGEIQNTDIPNGGTHYNNNTSNFRNSTYSSPSRKRQIRHTCNLCKGRKRIVKDTYPSLYGQSDYRIKCNECGGYFMRSTGHTHITCPQCHGKGYFTTN